jgi:hypothetical protein
MGYPYGDTYLEQIQKHKQECEDIRKAYYILVRKYAKEKHIDPIELTLTESFSLLGEAFELESVVLDGAVDMYHFIWDVLDALLTPKEENDSTNNLDKKD